MRDRDLEKAFDQVKLQDSRKAQLFEAAWSRAEQKSSPTQEAKNQTTENQSAGILVQEILPESRKRRFVPAAAVFLCVIIGLSALAAGSRLPVLRESDEQSSFSSLPSDAAEADGIVPPAESTGESTEESAAEGEKESSEQSAEEAIPPSEKTDNGPIKQLKMMNSQDTDSPDGFYEIRYTFGEGASGILHSNIVYTDFHTNTQSYLCKSSDCSHDSADCSSFFPGEGSMGINYVNGQLLIFENLSYNNERGRYDEKRLELADADGGNRRVLAKLDPKIDPEWSNDLTCADDRFFYFMSTEELPGTEELPEYERVLYRLDLQTGSCEEIEAFDIVDTYLIGADGDYLYFKQWEYNGETVGERDVSECRIMQMNPADSEDRRIVEEYNDFYWLGRMIGSTFYFYDKQKDTLNSHNYATEEERSIANTTGYELDSAIAYDDTKIIDGKLIFEAIVGRDIREEDGFETLIIRNFAWDLEAGTVSELNQLKPDDGRPARVVGSCDDRIYAVYEWNLDPQAAYIGKLAYISNADFFSGIFNYTLVTMLGDDPQYSVKFAA